MARSDYDAIGTKNGVRIPTQNLEDYHLLIEDGEFKIGFYKYGVYLVNENRCEFASVVLNNRKVAHISYQGVDIKIQHMYRNRYMCTFKHNDNFYRVYFGCGVDYKHMEELSKQGYCGITRKEIRMLKRMNLID